MALLKLVVDNKHFFVLRNAYYLFSKIKYAHASISFDNSFTQMYSFGRTEPDNPFSGGFVVENLYDGVYKKFSSCECMIYRVPVTEEQYQSMQRHVKEFIKEKDKMKYNFLGLIGVLAEVPLNRKNHYFCSQFVSEVLIEGNIFQSERIPELIKTSELFNIKNKEIIYEGLLNKGSRLIVKPAYGG